MLMRRLRQNFAPALIMLRVALGRGRSESDWNASGHWQGHTRSRNQVSVLQFASNPQSTQINASEQEDMPGDTEIKTTAMRTSSEEFVGDPESRSKGEEKGKRERELFRVGHRKESPSETDKY